MRTSRLALLTGILTLVGAGATTPANAAFPPGWQPIKLVNGTVTGVHNAHVGADPVLLVHGLFQDSRAWEDIGPALASAGFDVWAIDLSDSFSEIADRVLPEVVVEISRSTHLKVTVVGHSMGALATQLLASGGTVDSKPAVHYDSRAALAVASLLKGVAILSPPENLKALKDGDVPVNVPGLPFRLPLPLSLEDAIIDANGAIELLPQGAAMDDPLLVTLFSSHFTSIVNVAAFAQGELPRILAERIVPLSPALRDSFKQLVDAEISMAGIGAAGERGVIQVPALFAGGSLDAIAPPANIAQAACALAPRGMQSLLLQGNSHLDLINGARAGQVMGGLLARFIHNPLAPVAAGVTTSASCNSRR